MYPEGGQCVGITQYQNPTLLDYFHQDCGPPPPSCTLNITGVTSTNETISGAGDGTITIGISGNTGGTVTYTITKGLEVVTYSANVGSHTFTGVTTGQWTIRVQEGICYDTWSAAINILQGYFTTGGWTVSFPPTIVASENPIVMDIHTEPTGVAPAYGEYTTELPYRIQPYNSFI
jgi:hypothetical protein